VELLRAVRPRARTVRRPKCWPERSSMDGEKIEVAKE
jgi:hypothetical protein